MLKNEYVDAVTDAENAISDRSIDPGLCPGCEQCEGDHDIFGEEFERQIDSGELCDEGAMSLSGCTCCKRSFEGYHNLYAAHGMDNGEIVHYDICEDCKDYLNDGTLPDYLEDEIQDEDLVLSDCGELGSKTSLGYYNGQHIGIFTNDETAIQGAIARMNSDKCWPNVWRMSDHGNLSLVDLS